MDKNFTSIVCDIKLYFDKIDKCLDNMDGDSYIENNSKINDYLIEVKKLFDYIKSNYPSTYLAKAKSEIETFTKLLNKKFDNVIRIKNEELKELSKEINSMQNQKKISNYR
jgi:exonuclease VII large subunit